MNDSIAKELDKLESVGRVSARGQRQVHTGFGFSAIKKKEDAPTRQASGDVQDDLDDAFARLKARAAAE